MYAPTLRLWGFASQATRALDFPRMGILLEALAQIDAIELVALPKIPPLYLAGVRYVGAGDDEADDSWDDVLTVLERGWGDCEDLAAWRIAELRVRHRIAAAPAFVFTEDDRGTQRFHVLVRWPNGFLEDPSRALGM